MLTRIRAPCPRLACEYLDTATIDQQHLIQLVRFWGEAGMHDHLASTSSVADDPERSFVRFIRLAYRP
jgi:hypothetical protein